MTRDCRVTDRHVVEVRACQHASEAMRTRSGMSSPGRPLPPMRGPCASSR